MDPVNAFFLGLGGLMLLTIGALACVQRPLIAVLGELCGAEHRVRFWIRLFDATLVLLVVFFALWAAPDHARPAGFHDLLGMFRAGTFGLLCGLAALSFFVMAFVSRFEADQTVEEVRTSSESLPE